MRDGLAKIVESPVKKYFSCSLEGKSWWKTALGCMILFLLALIPLEFSLMNLDSPRENPRILLTWAFITVFFAMFTLALWHSVITIARTVIPTVAFGGTSFSVTGKKNAFSLQCRYGGEPVRFLGSTGKTFRHFLFSLVLPVAVWAFAFHALVAKTEAVKAAAAAAKKASALPGILLTIGSIAVFFLLFFIAIPFFCLFIRDLVNFKTKDVRVALKTDTLSSFAFLARQTLLVIITAGICWPLLVIRAWRYFACHTAWWIPGSSEIKVGQIGFDGNIKKGFALLWGQTLLCAVTLGIYFPWATARCIRFFMDNTYIELRAQ